MSEQIETEDQPPSIGLGRIINACGYSCAGLAEAWRNEGAFRTEVLAAVILIPVACYAPITTVERVLLIGSVLLTMVVELLNCGIEATIDRISLERHPLSKRAKDTASAAVFVSVLIGIITWAVVLGPWALQALR